MELCIFGSSDFCVDDVSRSVFLFTTKSTKDTKVSDISDPKCRRLRSEFASSKGQPPGGAPTDLKGEFFASVGFLAIKSSLLRALRVLRGENFFTVKPEEAYFLIIWELFRISDFELDNLFILGAPFDLAQDMLCAFARVAPI